MKGKFIWIVLISGIICILPHCKKEKQVTFKSLLLELVDREQLPQYPEPFYITRQFSSYDRASKSPDEGWFANWDRSMFIREEENQGRKEYVMMDADGPGAVVRFWMTFSGEDSGEGTLRIYFDDEEEPAIEGSAFDVLSRGSLTERPLSCSVSPETEYENRGHNLYMPLPYASHIKITYETDNIVDWGAKSGGEAVYYNINYRIYAEGTQVETFSRDILEQSEAVLKKVNTRLNERDFDDYLEPIDLEEITINGLVEPGNTAEYKLSGARAVREISFKLESENLEQALRSTVMEMEFDGHRTVWCPAGDFFGTGYQIRRVNTWYSRVTEDGLMRALWIMPFQDEAVIRFHNMGENPVEITQGKLSVSDWKWSSRNMHFGATWMQYTDLYTGESKTMEGGGHPLDLNYTHLKGEGVVAGNALALFNTAYSWWGEGDEKIFIDGEDFPSHFGTGTEDFYGYAWCRPEKFNEPFIAQPDGSGSFWPGYTVNIRYRVLDAMPFVSEIKFDMEMWHWASTRINYAPATFFYLKPGGDILIEPDEEGAQEKVALKREHIISPWIEGGSIEGENLIEVNRTDGNMNYPWNDQYGWSQNQQLMWREAERGDELLLGFKSQEPGNKAVTGLFTSGPDYGTVEIRINNGAPVRFNAFNSGETVLMEVQLETLFLNEGMNEVKIKMILPPPDKETGSIGFDLLRFK